MVGLSLGALPAIIERAGPRAAERTIEFFTAEIRNSNTRRAYSRAAASFFIWMERHGLALEQIGPVHVADWVQNLQIDFALTSVNQQLAAVRMLLDYLVTGGVLHVNAAAKERGQRYRPSPGKMAIIHTQEAERLLDAIPPESLAGLRDRALIALMVYRFARIGAALAMRAGDVFREQNQLMVRLQNKGCKQLEMPCHHLLEEYLTSYLEVAAVGADGMLFGPVCRSTGQISRRPLSRADAWEAVRRRARAVGIKGQIGNHSFIPDMAAQAVAGASPPL